MVLFTPIAPEFQVNANDITINTITNPDVGVADNGNFVVVWEDPFDNADTDILFRRFSGNGNPLDQNDIDVANSSANETQAAIAVAPDGSFVVTYVRNDDIYVRLFAADGNPRSNEILVSTFEQNKTQSAPDIAIDADGDFAVVWTHQFASDDSDIRGRLFRADGTPITNDIEVASSNSNESEPALAAIPIANNSSGNNIFDGVVTFTTEVNGNQDIFFSLYDNQNNQFSSPTNAISDDNLQSNQRESSVAIDPSGNFVISWTNEFSSNDEDVVLRRFSANGNGIDNLEIPVDEGSGNQNNSQIALANDGTIVVAYEDEVNNNVKYRQFDSNGQPLTDSIAYDVNSNVEENPALAIGNNNTLVITADDDQSNTFEPYGRIFNAGANNNTPVPFTPIAPEFQVNTNNITVNTITAPDVGVADNGNFVVVWEEPFQNNTNDKDIRFRRFSSDGTPLDQNDLDVAISGANETQSAIAVAPDGSFVVTYVKNDDVYVRLFAANGNPRGNEILVSTFEQDKAQFAPDIAIDADGDFAVVWTHQFANNDSDIRGRLFRADGTSITDDITVADSNNNESEAALAAISVPNNNSNTDIFDGVVTFTSDVNGNQDIFFSFYDNQNDEFSSPTNAVSNTNRQSNQRESSVAIDQNDNFVISWTNELSQNDEDVVFRRFDPNGDAIDNIEIPVDQGVGNQNDSQIALANDGIIVVAYEDEVNNNVKYRQFDSDGEPLTDAIAYGTNSNSAQQNPALAIGDNNNLVIATDDDQNNNFNPHARIFNKTVLNSPINRFQNSDLLGTFLFATEGESINIRRDFPAFIEEGLAFNVATQPGDDLIRINRFQNSDVPGTFLFATEGESQSIRRDFTNFDEEGIAFYVYGADANRGTDFYRFQNTDQPGTYIFVNQQERDNIIASFPQFELEGVAFEVG